MHGLLLLVCLTACQNSRLETDNLSNPIENQLVEQQNMLSKGASVEEKRISQQLATNKIITTFGEEEVRKKTTSSAFSFISIRNSLSNLFMSRIGHSIEEILRGEEVTNNIFSYSLLAPNLLIDASVSTTTPAASEQFCYKIRYRCASITEHCFDAEITFELHPSMNITSLPDAIGNVKSVNRSGNMVTIVLESPPSVGAPAGALAAGSAGIIKVCGKFKCVDEAGITAGSMVNFIIDPTFDVTGGSVSASAPAITVPTLNDCPIVIPPPPPGSFEKTSNGNGNLREGMPGSFAGWRLEVPLSSVPFSIIDTFPEGFRLYDSDNLEDGYSIEIDCGSGFVPFATGNDSNRDDVDDGLDSDDFDVGDFVLDTLGNSTDCTIDFWEAKDGSKIGYLSNAMALKLNVPANDSTGANIDIDFYVEESVTPGTYQNVATTTIPDSFPASAEEVEIIDIGPDIKLGGGCTEKIGSPLTDNSDFDEVNPFFTVDPFDVQFRLQIANSQFATEDVTQGFVAEILLDPELSFITDPANPNYWAIHQDPDQVAYLPACQNPTFEIFPNHVGTQTMLKWTFPPSCILEAGYTNNFGNTFSGDNRFPEIYFSARFNLSEPIGNDAGFDATIYLSDGGETNPNSTSISTSKSCSTPSGSSVNSAKYVQGAFDDKFHRFPTIGNTNLNGDGDFEIFIYQSGFDEITDIELADIMPYVGDVDMLAPVIARESEWSMELSQAITIERYKIGTGLVDASTQLGTDGVYYSTSTNPCFLDGLNDIDLAGTNGTFASCDAFMTGGSPVGARSWGFHWSNPSDPLIFGEYIKVTLKGVQLNGESDKTDLEVAWNSFAYSTTNDEGDVLTSQPIKVGLRMVDETAYAQLGSLVWKDANANGVQDPGEEGISGATVALFKADGTPVQDTVNLNGVTTFVPRTTTTDSLGNYCFLALEPNTDFIMRLNNPADYVGSGPLAGLSVTPSGTGTDGAADSDAVLGEGGGLFTDIYPEILGITTPNRGEKDDTFDFGFTQLGVICGHAFEDVDMEGDEDANEPDLDSIIVIAKDINGIEVGRDTTDEFGLYSIEVAPGIYTLEVDLSQISGLTYTASNVTGEDIFDSDVTSAGTIEGVAVAACGDVVCDNDIGLTEPPADPATIEGVVWDELGAKDGTKDVNEPLVSGITVQLLDEFGFVISTTTTDANGAYQFSDLAPNADYQVQFVPPNINVPFTGAGPDMDADLNGLTITITPMPNETISDIDAGLCGPYSLGNLVWNDADNDGLFNNEGTFPNVKVYLIDGTDGVTYLDTTMTDSNGKYVFTGLQPGDYIVEVEVPSGYKSSDDIASSGIPNGNDNDDNGIGTANTGRVQSNVVTIENTGGMPGDANWTESDHGQPINGVVDNTANPKAYYTVDFGFVFQELVGIGGTVWIDQGNGGGTQNDGTQDGEEPGIGAVLIELLNNSGMVIETTTTNPDGTYLFTDLLPGDYKVSIPSSNFDSGNPLNSLPFSSVPTTTTDNDDTDNDDNGTQIVGNGEVTSPTYTLSVGEEPSGESETLTPLQDGAENSSQDVNINTTVDFGFQNLVLPVELLSFKAKANKDHIDLTWSTASEFDNSHFELERSEDSKTFKKIARIDGQGTTLEISDYKYEDKEATHGVLYYYRLKQVDFDGKFTYSDIENARLEKASKDWMIYPNPISQAEMLHLNFFAETINNRFNIMDVHSRVVLSIERDLNPEEWHTIQVDVSSLPSGTYILIDNKGNTQRFAKVNQ